MNREELILLIKQAVEDALNERAVDNRVERVLNSVQVRQKTHNGEIKYHSIIVNDVVFKTGRHDEDSDNDNKSDRDELEKEQKGRDREEVNALNRENQGG